jgi:phosphoribosylformylglycinamidine synthase subunit PurQ / glutaminase
MIRICIITGYGINADAELVEAFGAAGRKLELTALEVSRVHIQDLVERPEMIDGFHILGFPGGFSFGDHLGSGKVLANMVRKNLLESLQRFIHEKKIIIGICNGFQVLVKTGILPNIGDNSRPETSLTHNDSGVFEDSWVRVTFNPRSRCIWTRGLSEMDLPIRHGEGRFLAGSEEILKILKQDNLVALTYSDRNPNGSVDGIAGITDTTGRIFGLMPHPEAFLFSQNHPRWQREAVEEGAGLAIFINGIRYIIKSFDVG